MTKWQDHDELTSLADTDDLLIRDVSDGTDGTVKRVQTTNLRLWDTDGTDVYRSSGDVGIGTSTPTYRLDVEETDSGTDAAVSVVHTGNRNAAIEIENSNNKWRFSNAMGTGNFLIYDSTNNKLPFTVEPNGVDDSVYIDSTGSIGFGTKSQFGGGSGVLGIADASTNPSSNPTAGVVLYSDTGELKVRDSSGNTTTLSPHADDYPPGMIVSESYPQVHKDVNPYLGLERWIAIGKMAELVQQLARDHGLLKPSENIMATREIPKNDWRAEEAEKAAAVDVIRNRVLTEIKEIERRIADAEDKEVRLKLIDAKEEKERGLPPAYVERPVPKWIADRIAPKK